MEPSPSPVSAPPDSSRVRPHPEPDFALDPFPAAPLPPGVSSAEHQRLVVNPFLAVAGLIGWAGLTVRLLTSNFPPLALPFAAALGGLPFLMHYHCFDCGATGTYPRSGRHACSRVLGRAHRNRVGWFRWPSARTQLVAWAYVLFAVAVLISAAGVGTGLLRR